MAIVRYACAFYVGQRYGGPEEGGWWYDTGEHLMSLPFKAEESATAFDDFHNGMADSIVYDEPARAAARATLRELCELAGHDVEDKDFAIYIEDEPGAHFPTERPRYD